MTHNMCAVMLCVCVVLCCVPSLCCVVMWSLMRNVSYCSVYIVFCNSSPAAACARGFVDSMQVAFAWGEYGIHTHIYTQGRERCGLNSYIDIMSTHIQTQSDELMQTWAFFRSIFVTHSTNAPSDTTQTQHKHNTNATQTQTQTQTQTHHKHKHAPFRV